LVSTTANNTVTGIEAADTVSCASQALLTVRIGIESTGAATNALTVVGVLVEIAAGSTSNLTLTLSHTSSESVSLVSTETSSVDANTLIVEESIIADSNACSIAVLLAIGALGS
jgi:hypothetical protein